jgi:hypothetical protein
MKRPAALDSLEHPFLLIPLATLIACWKLLASGPSCGHDFDFHLLSWMEAARHWHHGLLYPHWVTTANYGGGEPRFVFYPPLSWMLGALLGLVAGWNLAPLLFTALALLGGGAAMYLLAREWLPTSISTRAAALYMLSPYAGFVAYERTAYGELLAAAFVPLVLLFALRGRPSMAPLALSFAAVWLSNAPAGVMSGYMLGFVTVIVAIRERRWRHAIRNLGGGLTGLGLAAFYLVPAAVERRWVQIERAVGPGMRIEDSFLFGRSGEPFHDQVLATASWIATFMLTVSLAAAVALLLRRERSSDEFSRAKTLWIPLMALLPLILFLLLPLSSFVWAHAPEMAFLQFPWRWLLVAGIAYALLVAAVLRGGIALCLGLFSVVLLGGIQQQWFYQPCDDEDAVAAQITDFETGAGVGGTDEYVTHGADNSAIQKGLPQVRVLPSPDADAVDSSIAENPDWNSGATHESIAGSKIDVEREAGEHWTVQLRLQTSGFAVLRLMDYPAWEVRVNGAEIVARPRRDDGLLTVPIAAGVSRIDVSWQTTGDVWMGRVVSLLALLMVIPIAFRNRYSRVS